VEPAAQAPEPTPAHPVAEHARWSSSRILGADGPFAGLLQGLQLETADSDGRWWNGIAAQGTLVVEAGTGIGKTLAYLVPALQRAVIVSTEPRPGGPAPATCPLCCRH
jgi:hypothetical protein